MEHRVAELEHEVESLQTTVGILTADLNRLRKRLRLLEADREEDDLVSRASGSVAHSFSVVGSIGAPPASRTSSAPSPGPSPGSASQSADPAVLTWARREEICDGIAAWVLRCIRGEHRGTSGRDLIPLGNRIWLVFRDIVGTEYRPVRVFRTFALAKDLVKRGSDSGDSIYVGLPSEREARRVAAVAGVGWPEDF